MGDVVVLEASPALKRRYDRMRREAGIKAFLKAVKSGEVKQRLRPMKTAIQPRDDLRKPTPQRLERAADSGDEVVEAAAPPFNAQIIGAAHTFAKQLGPETMRVLERFYEIGRTGIGTRGMTASYGGFKIDVSRTDYQHLTDKERGAHELFRRALLTMPPDLRAYAMELIFDEGRARSPAEIGYEVANYKDRAQARAVVAGLLQAIAWCVQEEFSKGARHGKAIRNSEV